MEQMCLDPGSGSFFPGSGSGREKIMVPDPFFLERLDHNPNSANSRPDSKPRMLPNINDRVMIFVHPVLLTQEGKRG